MARLWDQNNACVTQGLEGEEKASRPHKEHEETRTEDQPPIVGKRQTYSLKKRGKP